MNLFLRHWTILKPLYGRSCFKVLLMQKHFLSKIFKMGIKPEQCFTSNMVVRIPETKGYKLILIKFYHIALSSSS